MRCAKEGAMPVPTEASSATEALQYPAAGGQANNVLRLGIRVTQAVFVEIIWLPDVFLGMRRTMQIEPIAVHALPARFVAFHGAYPTIKLTLKNATLLASNSDA